MGKKMEEKVRAHAFISGRVQGVFFRMETKRAAQRLGVFGWVRNLRDGNVEAVFEGDETRIDAMINWCKEGPPHAHVTDVKVDFEKYTGEFDSFEIKY
jgi:acylphosphatase